MRAIIGQNGRVQQLGLSGLGLVNVAWCDSFEQAIDLLGEVVRRGGEEGLTSPDFINAKKVHESETSLNLFSRTPVHVGNCTDRTQGIVNLALAVNKQLKQPAPVPANLGAKVLPPEEVPTWVKLALIGGIAVVGTVAVAYMTGQVAPLFRAFKR